VVEAPARRDTVRHGELVAVNAAVFAPWAL
jgi:UDP-3-O-[3-hydroxymyristoyl] N-acetylglucosamine deacetylase